MEDGGKVLPKKNKCPHCDYEPYADAKRLTRHIKSAHKDVADQQSGKMQCANRYSINFVIK